MSFLYPLGLLGLIGIPILIFIYIIKNKYTEQTVASTYLWTLSERFLKRRRRVSRLAGIISLILQILAVTLISLLIAHPIITVPNSANEYCFILDGSGSMRMEASDVAADGTVAPTRFEKGKGAIAAAIDEAVDGSLFTLVYMGDTTSVIYERLEDKEQALLLLDELEPACATIDPADALRIAQDYYDENRGLEATLVTDKNYQTTENITVHNVAEPVENYAVTNVTHSHRGDDLSVTGEVISYTSDATLTVTLSFNGEAEPVATTTVSVTAGVPTSVTLSAKVSDYSSYTIRVTETDALSLDNEFSHYDVRSENSYNTLIISERPFFLESALRSLLGGAKIDVMEPEAYTGQTGYGLYIFDTIDPSTLTALPTDGTVWLMNIAGSIEGAGYTVQGEVTLEKADLLTHATSTSSATQKLVEGMKQNDIFITRYIKCGVYRNFTTLLSFGGYPVVFAGTNENGNREVVFAFDIHDSNLPLLYDYAVLLRNLVSFSFPDMVDKTEYAAGDAADVNVLVNCESIRVESPSGGVTYLDTTLASDSVRLSEVGEYRVTMTVAGTQRQFSLWSALPEAERTPVQTEPSLALQGERAPGGFDGRYDPLILLFIALAVVFLADWMVYCYEKYQLR